MRKLIFLISQIIKYVWYFMLLKRKRDIVKDRDCADFEDTKVPIDAKSLNQDGVFNEWLYEERLMANDVSIGHTRQCQGDGHYMCARCKWLDYRNSDAFSHLFQKED